MRHLLLFCLLLIATSALAGENKCGILLSEGDNVFGSPQVIAALNSKGYSVSQVVLQSGIPSYDVDARFTIESYGSETLIPFNRSCSLEVYLKTRNHKSFASGYSGTIEGADACTRAAVKVIEQFPVCPALPSEATKTPFGVKENL